MVKKDYFSIAGSDIKGKIIQRNFNGFKGLYLGKVLEGEHKGKELQFKNDKNTLLYRWW